PRTYNLQNLQNLQNPGKSNEPEKVIPAATNPMSDSNIRFHTNPGLCFPAKKTSFICSRAKEGGLNKSI
ncbi:MAG: hypothetical protein E7F65_05965, partial [Alloscardovia omnicolens]|nr:hypothetical protein [Alloscardovia omnicolens]